MSGRNRGQFSDEHKAKLSAAIKGHTVSEETRAKISRTKTGKKLSESARNKTSKATKGKIWINNGEITKRVKPDEVNILFASGFTLGRLL